MTLLEALHDISHQLSSNLGNVEIVRTICQELATRLGLGYVAVIRWEDTPGRSSVDAEYPARVDGAVPPLPHGLYDYLRSVQAPSVIRQDDTDRSTALKSFLPMADFGVALASRLQVRDQDIGALLLAGGAADRTFSPDEMYFIKAVAVQMTLSLRNRALSREIQRRVNQLEQSTNFGRLVTSTFDRDKILKHVADVIPSLLPVDQVSVTLYSSGQSQMEHIMLTLDAPLEKLSLPVAGSSVEEVANTQTALLFADLESSNYTDHQRFFRQGVRSLVIAPLVVGGRTLGTLNVGHQHPGIYTPTDQTLLQQFGNQIAIALENARQFQIAQHHAAYEQALSEITLRLQQQSDLRSLLQQTMQDLGRVLGAKRARVRLETQPGTSKE
ncbi:MAG: GAF domain-containing protein [Anaerolineae bacterium]|nr:GAF domain-containing protein [Anaerolineae bacterium]